MAEGLPKGIANFADIHRQAEQSRARKHPWQAQVDATSKGNGVDTRKLYDWLGEQVKIARHEVSESLDSLHGPDEYYGMEDAYRQVRRHMRRFDKSLPKTSADRT
jgi:hypothetical protein